MFDMLIRLCRLNKMKWHFIRACWVQRKRGTRTHDRTEVLNTQSHLTKVQRRWCLFLTWRPYKTAVDILYYNLVSSKCCLSQLHDLSCATFDYLIKQTTFSYWNLAVLLLFVCLFVYECRKNLNNLHFSFYYDFYYYYYFILGWIRFSAVFYFQFFFPSFFLCCCTTPHGR